jgi:hypothetical protein
VLLLIAMSVLWYTCCYKPLQAAASFYRENIVRLLEQKNSLETKVTRLQDLSRRDSHLFALIKKKCKAAVRKCGLHHKHILTALKKSGLSLLASEQLEKKEFSDWMLTTHQYVCSGTFDEHSAFLALLSAQRAVFCKKALYVKREGILCATYVFWYVEKG